jgi:hypothetical protein
MSGLKRIHPVLRCKRCRAYIVVKEMQTYRPDPDGSMLREWLRHLEKTALCPNCQNQYNYYASQNRLQDWERGDV